MSHVLSLPRINLPLFPVLSLQGISPSQSLVLYLLGISRPLSPVLSLPGIIRSLSALLSLHSRNNPFSVSCPYPSLPEKAILSLRSVTVPWDKTFSVSFPSLTWISHSVSTVRCHLGKCLSLSPAFSLPGISNSLSSVISFPFECFVFCPFLFFQMIFLSLSPVSSFLEFLPICRKGRSSTTSASVWLNWYIIVSWGQTLSFGFLADTRGTTFPVHDMEPVLFQGTVPCDYWVTWVHSHAPSIWSHRGK